MKKTTLSLVVASLIATSSYAASSVEEAFKNGKVSGDVTLYTTSTNNQTNGSGYTNGSLGLNYDTDTLAGFKASVGFRANHMFDEENKNDYNSGNSEPKSLIHTANISYTTEGATVIIGRQPIDLEWMGDYHEAAVAVLTYVPNTTIVVGYTQRKTSGESDADEALTNFVDFNNHKGAYVVDATIKISDMLTLGAYYMDAPNLFSAIGGKVEANVGPVSLLGKYATSYEDVSTKKDGNIYQLEASTSVDIYSASLGYIATDKTGAIGSLSALGDNINPFEDGNQVYATDAKTTYGTLGATFSGIEASILYGSTDYAGNNTEKELDVGLAYSFTDALSLSVLYVDVDVQGSADYNKYLATLTYSF